MSEEDYDKCDSYNPESLRFFYNLDIDNSDDGKELDKTCSCEETLPEIFNDGQFELVDGLIVLVENPAQKKFDLKSRVFHGRKIKCSEKNQLKSTAA